MAEIPVTLSGFTFDLRFSAGRLTTRVGEEIKKRDPLLYIEVQINGENIQKVLYYGERRITGATVDGEALKQVDTFDMLNRPDQFFKIVRETDDPSSEPVTVRFSFHSPANPKRLDRYPRYN